MKPRFALAASVVAVVAFAVAFLVTRRTAPPAARPSAGAPAAPHPTWTPAEKKAVDAAIAAAAAGAPKLSLRAADDKDAADTDEHHDLDAVYGTYHPYFARGDLDGDGRLDFVQAFVEKGRSGAWFHVAAFFGRADGSFDGPFWVERAISLANGDVTVERSLVVVTPDLAADPSRRWRWEPGERLFVDPDSEPRPARNPDDDAPDETPEQKPRARI